MYFKCVVYNGPFTFTEFGTPFDNAEPLTYALVANMQHVLNSATFTLDVNKGDLKAFNYNSVAAHEEIFKYMFILHSKCTSLRVSKHNEFSIVWYIMYIICI